MLSGVLGMRLEAVEGVEGRDRLEVEEVAACWAESDVGEG